MAVNPILIKAIAKVAVTAATDEEMRKKILIILLIPIIAVLLILSMFYYILSQPFAVLTDILGDSSDTPYIEQFRSEKGYILQGEGNDVDPYPYLFEK